MRTPALPQTEREVQAQIVAALKTLGYLVQETSLKIRGKHNRWNLAVGIDAGISDLLVGRKSWGPIRVCLEVKGPKTVLSAKQQELYDDGLIYIVRSLDDALVSLGAIEIRFGLPGPAQTAQVLGRVK